MKMQEVIDELHQRGIPADEDIENFGHANCHIDCGDILIDMSEVGVDDYIGFISTDEVWSPAIWYPIYEDMLE